MYLSITNIYLNDIEIIDARARELLTKYVHDHMTMEGFMGGCDISTPEGILRADVELINK
jgi:hypothetical protein